MRRRVLVTQVVNTLTGVTSYIYGRYDAVALVAKNLQIVKSGFAMYEMSDSDFVKHGKFIKEVEK